MTMSEIDRWVLEWMCWVVRTRNAHAPHTRDENDLRLGQKMFNKLYELRPDIAGRITGSLVDPFHDDDRIPEFLEKVDELWMS